MLDLLVDPGREGRGVTWTWRRPAPTTNNTNTTEEITLPTTYTGPEAKVASLRGDLAAVDTEAAGDPVELADDLDAWSRRDQARRARRLTAATELRRVAEFGELLDNGAAMEAVRFYTAATAEARSGLAPVVRDRAFPGDRRSREPRRYLLTWWAELDRVGAVLPAFDPDGDRWLSGELTAWFDARDAVVAAYLLVLDHRDPIEVPAPERDGLLPGGLTRAIVRPVPIQDGAA